MPFFALLRANWKVAGAILLVLALATYVGAQNRRIAALQRELQTKVGVVTQADLARLQQQLAEGQAALIQRQTEFFAETLRLTRSGGGTVLIREVTGREGPPGAPGAPGRAGTPGKVGEPGGTAPGTAGGAGVRPQPLIPEGQLPQAREGATERITVGLYPGHLVNCPTPGLSEADAIELLRDKDGRLLSGTSCVRSIRDEVKLPELRPAEVRLPYHLGVFIAASMTASPTFTVAPKVGVEYTNRVWRGFYRVEVACLPQSGQVCPAPRFEVRYIHPIR